MRTSPSDEVIKTKISPYPFARLSVDGKSFLDLSRDGHDESLANLHLPVFHHPGELASWLKLPVGKIAWLTERFTVANRPLSVNTAHYHFTWLKKRSGGYRLIESPKQFLRAVQDKILAEILENVGVHDAAHGFIPGRSILTNALPHVNKAVVVKVDLESFYRRIRFSRIVAIFRALGYSREMGIWLGRLTTSAAPSDLNSPSDDARANWEYLPRHLPQGAPTSPYLANLCAYSLDVRLSGLAKRFGATYTRYADDLTFSGDEEFQKSLSIFFQLMRTIIKEERFRLNSKKSRVLRISDRQTVTGVVVNEATNPSRKEFDRLKAILHNCKKLGPTSQNKDNHENFAAHLRGRISHMNWLNPIKGKKLLAIYNTIDWSK
ncbi:reverse transcriptase family protein [Lacunimicrobium album]